VTLTVLAVGVLIPGIILAASGGSEAEIFVPRQAKLELPGKVWLGPEGLTF
jgi:hypothetical protein